MPWDATTPSDLNLSDLERSKLKSLIVYHKVAEAICYY